MEEYKWLIGILFGGLGTTIIGYFFFKKSNSNRLIQKQKSGDNSQNIQVGGAFTIKHADENEQK